MMMGLILRLAVVMGNVTCKPSHGLFKLLDGQGIT
jgi:hypothetical protein